MKAFSLAWFIFFHICCYLIGLMVPLYNVFSPNNASEFLIFIFCFGGLTIPYSIFFMYTFKKLLYSKFFGKSFEGILEIYKSIFEEL
jgi:hypothetical protein